MAELGAHLARLSLGVDAVNGFPQEQKVRPSMAYETTKQKRVIQ